MAILSITAADVRTPTGGAITLVTAGAAVAIGEFVYQNASTSKYAPADNSAQANAAVAGVAVTTADADGDTFVLLTGPELELASAAFTQGKTYFLSSTAGDIEDEDDLATNDWITRIGTAQTTTKLALDISALAFQKT